MKHFFRIAVLGLSLFTPSTPSVAQAVSDNKIDEIYQTLKTYAKTDEYKNFQKDLVVNHQLLHFQSRKATHVFMSAIAKGKFDDDTRIKTSLVACATRSIQKLARDRGLPSGTPLVIIANQAAQDVRNATEGQSDRIDCKHAYDDYYAEPRIFFDNATIN